MSFMIFIQTRMNSLRCPGKVLRTIGGKAMLKYVIECVDKTGYEYAVLTSVEDTDLPIVEFCCNNGITCFRGDLNNVAGRFLDAVSHFRPDAFLRISADSPFINWKLLAEAVRIYERLKPDMLTNVMPRSYPKGQSVEILNAEVFRREYCNFCEDDDFEHVTKYFYRNAGKFHIVNLPYPGKRDFSDIQLSVDTEEDFALAVKMSAAMELPHWEYSIEELMELKVSCGK